MTSRPIDTSGAEYNKFWKTQQPKPPKPVTNPTQEKPAGSPPAKPPQMTQPICKDCVFRKGPCGNLMRLWGSRAPRPDLARGWYRHISEHCGKMPCLREEKE